MFFRNVRLLFLPMLLASAGAYAAVAVPPGPPMGLYHFFVKTNCYSLQSQQEEWAPYWPWESAVPVFPGSATIVGVTISAPDLIYIKSSNGGVIPNKNAWQLAGPSNGLGYPRTYGSLSINEPKSAPTVVNLDANGQYPFQVIMGFLNKSVLKYLSNRIHHNLSLSVYPRQELQQLKIESPKAIYQVGDTVRLRADWAYVNPQSPRIIVARANLERVTIGSQEVAFAPNTAVPAALSWDEDTRHSYLDWEIQLPNSGPTAQSELQSSVMSMVDLDLHVKAQDTSSSCNLLTGTAEHSVRIKVANPYYAPLQYQQTAPIPQAPKPSSRKPAVRKPAPVGR